jgi:hypothetical protein
MGLVVQTITDGRNATHHLVTLQRNEVFGLGMLEEGILGAGEQCRHVPTQRRDPERVPRMQPIRQIDEATKLSPFARRLDA